MGQMADDMIDGYSCSGCGVYFEEEHGYPVVCKDCHAENAGLPFIPKATHPEL